jgi:hypothetical protein
MRLRWRPRRKPFDETYYESIAEGVGRLLEQGVDPDRAVQVAAEAAGAALEKSSHGVAQTLVKRSPRMLRQRRRQQRRFARRLRTHWGEALDLVYVLIVCAEEAGATYYSEHADEPEGAQLREALSGLHARGCRTALEVYHLLAAGLGMGALARCRTLHELAVTAMVLSEYGSQPEHADLAERFLLHEDIISLKDAVVYQEHWEVLGVQPITPEAMDAIKERSEALARRFGPSYKKDYGWANGLDGIPIPTFRDLERLASVHHLRGYYRWASHEVHADAKGWALNNVERGGQMYKLSGYTNVGLADPGQMAVISLNQLTVALLLSHEDPSPGDLLALMAIQHLVTSASEALADGESAVEQAEESHQASGQTPTTHRHSHEE